MARAEVLQSLEWHWARPVVTGETKMPLIAMARMLGKAFPVDARGDTRLSVAREWQSLHWGSSRAFLRVMWPQDQVTYPHQDQVDQPGH